MSDCVGDDLATRLIEGQVSSGERLGVEQHLPGCSDCRELIAVLARGLEVGDSPSDGSDVGGASALDALASLHFGRYKLLSPLGAGASGLVYRAYDPKLDRDIAIKLVGALGDSRRQERLLREAQAMARLSHPNVVSVHDVGEENGEPFVAMELLEGGTLAQWLSGAERSWQEISKRLCDVAGGLASIHQAQLVHRDVKPANIFVSEDGRTVLGDLGLAGVTQEVGANRSATVTNADGDDSGWSSNQLTSTNSQLGTPAYMAPEQESESNATPASDQFSFALTLCQSLLGYLPSGAERASPSSLVATLRARGVPRRLATITVRGLKRDPGDRFPSMEAMHNELRHAFGPRRGRAMLAVVAAVALVAVEVTVALGARSRAVDACDTIDAQADALWAEKRDLVRSRTGSLVSDVGGLWTRVDQSLTGQVDDWRQQRMGLCTEDPARNTTVAALQTACLEQRSSELRSIVEILTTADADLLRTAPDVVFSLSSMAICEGAHPVVLPAVPPAQAEDIHRQQVVLATVKALVAAGKFPDAATVADGAVSRATELGYEPLRAEALLSQGMVAAVQGDERAAQAALESALAAAERGAHDRVRGLALSALLSLRDLDSQKALDYGERALTVLDRLSDDLELRATIKNRFGMLLAKQRQLDRADTELSESLVAWKKLRGDSHPELAPVYLNLGSLAYRQGNREKAKERFNKAISLTKESFGENHPRYARALLSLGTSVATPEAISLNRQAAGIFRRSFGDNHRDTLHAVVNVCALLTRNNQVDEAVKPCTNSVAISREIHGKMHSSHAWALLALGRLQVTRESHADGLATLEHALMIWDEIGGDAIEISNARYYAAAALLGLRKEPKRAIDLATSARKTWAADPLMKNYVGGLDGLLTELRKLDR